AMRHHDESMRFRKWPRQRKAAIGVRIAKQCLVGVCVGRIKPRGDAKAGIIHRSDLCLAAAVRHRYQVEQQASH
ncbi:MAG: hypothetical protein O3A51_11830, partial [Verrucomicrobia bacterium]|nr:hypothetical protein [Verrucomicrobiota bacterium]